MSRVTVLIPTYNVEKYIAKCLNSIQSQTFHDFDCLVVIDGSKDHSADIAKEFSSQDCRFKVYEKENGGYGSVLEYAIKNIKTEYLIICDPDDYLENDALEELIKLADTNTADITIGTRKIFYEGSEEFIYDPIHDPKIVSLHNGLYEVNDKNFNDVLMVNCSPHSKLYRTSLLEKLAYPKKVSYTDNILFYTTANKAKRIVFTEEPYSNYLQNRPGNSVTQLKSKYIYEHVVVYKFILNYLEKCTNINEFIYYRIFDSFKILFYNLRYVEGDEITKQQLKAELFSLLKMLMVRKSAIIKYQKDYSSEGPRAQFKNKLLLNKNISKMVFDTWLKKLED